MSKTTPPINRKRTALIDADGILYAAALKGEMDVDGERLPILDVSFIYEEVIREIEKTMDATRSENAFIILSDRRNFRYDVLPSYKGCRPKGTRPILLDELRRVIVEKSPYPVLCVVGLEADDVCTISAGRMRLDPTMEPVVCSPDKDLLQATGLVWQDKKMVVVTEKSADEWHIYQTLVGDTADCYKGCPNVGPVKAWKLLAENQDPVERWKAVVKAFEAAGLTEEDALVQARVARMTRYTDWDEARKSVILWNPPRDPNP